MAGMSFPTYPGRLSDEAFQEQLKLFTKEQNLASGGVPPSSALDMADRVKTEFIDQPTRRATAEAPKPQAQPQEPPTPPQESMPLMRGLLGPALGVAEGVAGFIDSGTLDPQTAAVEQQERIQAAEEQESAVKRAATARQGLRNLTDDQARELGMPVAPGVDPESAELFRQESARREGNYTETQLQEAEKATTTQRENAPTDTWWMNSMKEAYKGNARGLLSTAGGAARMTDYLFGDMDGNNAVVEWAQQSSKALDAVMPPDRARAEDFVTQLSAAGGNFAGQLMTYYVGGPALAIPAGMLQQGEEQARDAEQFGAAGMQKFLAFAAGASLGAAEYVPMMRAFSRADNASGGLVRRMLQNTAATSFEEFSTEVAQAFGQDAFARLIYDENREFDVGDYATQGLIGGILGAGLGASVSGLREGGIDKGRAVPTQEQETPQAPTAPDEQEAVIDLFISQKLDAAEAAAAQLDTVAAAVDPSTQAMLAPSASPATDVSAVTDQLLERAQTERRPATIIAEEFVNALPRPPVYNYEEIEGRGGTVPAPGPTGTIVLRHYGRSPYQTLDPAMRGTGPLRGAERANLFGPDAVDRTYYGVYTGDDFVQPSVDEGTYTALTPQEQAEAARLGSLFVTPERVSQFLTERYRTEARRRAGYVRESRELGDYVHEVEVDPNDLYNIEQDVLNLNGKIGPSLRTASERLTRLERLVKEAGFKGYYAPSSELGQTAVLFEAATPRAIRSERYGLPLDEIAKPSDFDDISLDSFRKGGWSIITGTQASLGDYNTPENLAANEALRSELDAAGVRYKIVRGTYEGTPDGDSYLVFMPEREAAELARKYNQDSILTRRGLEYSDGRITPLDLEDSITGDLARGRDYVSVTEDGQAFSLGLDFDATTSPTVELAVQGAMALTGDNWTAEELSSTLQRWGDALTNENSNYPLASRVRALASDLAEAYGPAASEAAGGVFTELTRDGTNPETIIRAGLAAAGDPRLLEQGASALERASAEALGRGPEPQQGPGPEFGTPFAAPDETLGIAEEPPFFAQTASNRPGLAAEQSRPQGGVPGATDLGQADVRLTRIADTFTKLLSLTVRQGRFTLRGSDVVGQYSSRFATVRLRTWNDLSALVHEGGHALQARAHGPLKQFIDANKAPLTKVAEALYGGDLSNASASTKVSEGFAEFFRIYTLNRAFAERKYKPLVDAFDAVLDQNSPELKLGLRSVGDSFAAWLQLPSAQLVANMVVSGKQDTGVNAAIAEMREQGFGTWFRSVVNDTITQTTNKYNNLNNLVADLLNVGQFEQGTAIDLKRADDPRVLIRLATNSGQRAMVQTTDGVMGYRSTKAETRGLREAMLRYHGLKAGDQLPAIDPQRQQDFAAYLIALRGIDEYGRLAQGKIERPPVNASLGDLKLAAKELYDKYGDDFAQAAEIVHEYGMGLWKKSYDAGLISKETYDDGLTRNFYAPLQRDLSDRNVSTGDISAASVGQGQKLVRRFRGSDRDIIDPMDSLMAKTFSLERVIAENEIKKALAQLSDRAGKAGALVERIPASRLIGEQFTVQEIGRALTKDETLSETDAQDLMTMLEASISEGNRIALFRSQQAATKGENIVFFWENGKLAALQIKDGDVGADIVNTLNGIGTENLPVLVDLVAHTSTVFRAAITSWPDFLLVNFIRDQVSAFILTDVGYKPFATGIRGMGDELRQHDWARQYNAAMGVMGGMNSAALHQARVERDINALRAKGYVAQVVGGGGVGGAIKGFARVTELSETGTRLGIFRNAYERAKADGLTDWEASIEASYIATDYIDFSLNGNKMLLFRRLIPFLNAQLQGLYKMMRTLGGGEAAQRKGLMFALGAYFKDVNNMDLSRVERQAINTGRKAWVKMASLGLLSALIYAAFEDDPDYQEAGEYLRTTGWVIPMGNGRIFYIPKPFELAMIANFVERGLEHASGDGEAKNRFLRGAAMNLLPPTSPPALQVLVEQMANYNFFGERDIVPDYMRALAPELQYNHHTSEFAKQIGGLFGWSPMRVDHVLSGLGASAYRDLVTMYNTMDPNRPSSDTTDWPITRRFVRDARRGSASAQDFWKFASTVDGSLRSAEVTYRNYIDGGRDAAANEFLSTLQPEERAYALLNTHFKAEAKRLNPMYRVRQLNTITSAMRREMVSDLGLGDTSDKNDKTASIPMSATQKYEIEELLSEYSRREMRNTLIYTGAPGWQGKQPLPTEPTIELLRATNPEVAEEFERRVAKAKVYTAEVVQEYWPEVRDRLLSDREEAQLDDVVSIAKVMR